MFERIRPLAPYLKRYWKNLACGGVAVIAYNVFRVMIPPIVGHALDDMQKMARRKPESSTTHSASSSSPQALPSSSTSRAKCS